MRTEASNQSPPLSTSTQGLSNPLTSSTGDERTPKAARFDFYTDPMAAFSGSKMGNPSPGGGLGGGGPYCSPQSFSSPIRSPSPLSYPSNRPSCEYFGYSFGRNIEFWAELFDAFSCMWCLNISITAFSVNSFVPSKIFEVWNLRIASKFRFVVVVLESSDWFYVVCYILYLFLIWMFSLFS